MVVEDEEQLNKVENIQDMLPELQAIIQYTGFPRSVITPLLTSFSNSADMFQIS